MSLGLCRVLVLSIAVAIACAAAPAVADPPGEDRPALLRLDSPLDYQVFQRRDRGTGAMRLRGALVRPGTLAVRIARSAAPDEAAITPPLIDWQAVAVDPAGNFDSQLTLPAGGWYRVELRLAEKGSADSKPAGEVVSVVEHVGVGEVFVVAGQSNSTNWGSERQKTATQLVSAFDGSHWRLADDPQPGVQDGSQGGSFLPAMGDALVERLGVPIGLASTGAGGTSVRQWLPAGETMTNLPTVDAHVRQVSPGVWAATGELFAGLERRIAALGPHGCRAVLWHQGESDAGQARAGYPADRQITGRQYRQFMETLVRASHRQAGWDISWLTAVTTYHNPQDAADEEFRTAQRALWQDGLTRPGPDTDALGAAYRDGNHFNAKGQREHGRLWAEQVIALLSSLPGDLAAKP